MKCLLSIHNSHNMHILVNKNTAINENDDYKHTTKKYTSKKERPKGRRTSDRVSTFIKQQLRVRNKQRIAPIPYSCLVVSFWLMFGTVNICVQTKIKREMRRDRKSLFKPNLLVFTHLLSRCLIHFYLFTLAIRSTWIFSDDKTLFKIGNPRTERDDTECLTANVNSRQNNPIRTLLKITYTNENILTDDYGRLHTINTENIFTSDLTKFNTWTSPKTNTSHLVWRVFFFLSSALCSFYNFFKPLVRLLICDSTIVEFI